MTKPDTSTAAVERHIKRTHDAASIFRPSNGHINVLVKRAKLSCEMLVIIASERDALSAALQQSQAETAAMKDKSWAKGMENAAAIADEFGAEVSNIIRSYIPKGGAE